MTEACRGGRGSLLAPATLRLLGRAITVRSGRFGATTTFPWPRSNATERGSKSLTSTGRRRAPAKEVHRPSSSAFHLGRILLSCEFRISHPGRCENALDSRGLRFDHLKKLLSGHCPRPDRARRIGDASPLGCSDKILDGIDRRIGGDAYAEIIFGDSAEEAEAVPYIRDFHDMRKNQQAADIDETERITVGFTGRQFGKSRSVRRHQRTPPPGVHPRQCDKAPAPKFSVFPDKPLDRASRRKGGPSRFLAN
jgi:hypothetical protein